MTKIRIETTGPVRTITLTRPEKRNALDADMLAALRAAFEAPAAATERVTVVRAEGPVFCAGLDLTQREAVRAGTSSIEAMLHAVETYPLPVVAIVQGDAIAGGNELALHCDLVVASTAARFGMSLAQIGLAPTWFLAKKLLEAAGPVGAREILLLGDPLPATRMAALGIIYRAVPADALADESNTVVARLAANAPLSMRAIKALLNREMCFRDGIYHADVDALVTAASNSHDAREGIEARMSRRTPEFDGK